MVREMQISGRSSALWGKEIDLVPGENPRIEIAPVPERVVKKMEEF